MEITAYLDAIARRGRIEFKIRSLHRLIAAVPPSLPDLAQIYARALTEREEQLAAFNRDLATIRRELKDEITRRVSNTKIRDVLIAHYVNRQSFKEIARGMGYSISAIYNFHRRGLIEWKEPLQ